MKLIGGFYALHIPQHSLCQQSLYELWGLHTHSTLMLHNARSCLHFLLRDLKIKKLWLPAYICSDIANSIQHTSTQLAYFPLTSQLSPDLNFLADSIQAGDMVLAVDYFGHPPAAEFLNFVKNHAEIIWVEDRAQALWPAEITWGDWVLYSPRKLLGIPDGGILLNTRSQKPPAVLTEALTDSQFITPYLLRLEDTAEKNNQHWYSIFVETEKKMQVGNLQMSELSQQLLKTIDVVPLIEQRKKNYCYLVERLKPVALYPEDDFVPLGFPIRLNNRNDVFEHLRKNKIFAQRHWPDLPSAAEQFPHEHKLASELLTLPCDHRYNVEDMKRISELILEQLC